MKDLKSFDRSGRVGSTPTSPTTYTKRESPSEYKYGLDIHKTDEYVHINSWSCKVEDWPEVAAWIIQTVATLQVEETTITIDNKGGPSAEILNQELRRFAKHGAKLFERDDTFYRNIKKK